MSVALQKEKQHFVFLSKLPISNRQLSMLNPETDIQVGPDKLVMKARSTVGLI